MNYSKQSKEGCFILIGLKEIQQLMRQSIKQPPFSLSNSADWNVTATNAVPVKEIYSKLRLTRKRRRHWWI